MDYSVSNILEKRRQKNKRDKDRRVRQVYDRLPRIKEIDGQIQRLNLESVNTIIYGGNLETMQDKISKLNQEKEKILRENGLDKSYMEERYHCDICQDTGLVKGKSCSCKKQLKIEKLYDLSSIDKRIKRENFNKFNEALFRKQRMANEELSPYENIIKIKKSMEFYCSHFAVGSPNLYFYGPVGTGKTYMINSMAKELLDRGVSVLYQSASELTEYLSSYTFMYSEEKKLNREKADFIYKADLLIIDDLGTEFINELTKSNLFEVINKRIVNGRTTIISSNIAPYELENYYDARIYSRIMGEYRPYEFFGNDLRMKNF